MRRADQLCRRDHTRLPDHRLRPPTGNHQDSLRGCLEALPRCPQDGEPLQQRRAAGRRRILLVRSESPARLRRQRPRAEAHLGGASVLPADRQEGEEGGLHLQQRPQDLHARGQFLHRTAAARLRQGVGGQQAHRRADAGRLPLPRIHGMGVGRYAHAADLQEAALGGGRHQLQQRHAEPSRPDHGLVGRKVQEVL